MKIILYSLLSISGISCSLSQRELASDSKSDFLSLCQSILITRGQSTQSCQTLHQQFFKNTADKISISTIKPDLIGAPLQLIDQKIHYFVVKDPNYIPGLAYCYFSYRGWIDSKNISRRPDRSFSSRLTQQGGAVVSSP